MKALSMIGVLLLLGFASEGMLTLWSVARDQMNVALCIWAFVSATGVGFGLCILYLLRRIAAVERQLQGRG